MREKGFTSILLILIVILLAAGGIYYYNNNLQDEQLNLEIKTEDSRAQTYKGSSFLFEYPTGWNLKEDGQKITLEKLQELEANGPYPAQTYTNTITITTTNNTSKTNLDDWLVNLYGDDKVLLPLIQKSAKRIKIDNADALEAEIPGSGGYYTHVAIVMYKDKVYEVNAWGLEGGSRIPEAYQDILSTFKFNN